MRFLTLCVALVAALTTVACGNDSSPSGARGEDITALQTIDTTVGSGAAAVSGQRITVHYTVWLYSSTAAGNKGTQIETSRGRAPYQFVLGLDNVIAGWHQGIPGMRVGGSRTLLIPSGLAYGSRGSQDGSIPPNSAIVFDIELVSIP